MTFMRDFIPELPVEIRIGITEYLDLPDLIAIRCVSRRWHECWIHISICNKLMKQYFRSAFENTYMLLPDDEKPTTFMAASDRLYSMRKGQYHSMAILRYDRAEDEAGEPSPILDRQYNNGRIAWTIDGGIKVSTICTGITKTYLTPDREKAQFWTLSGKFVVARTGDKLVTHFFTLQYLIGIV
jgi:F-box domain